MQRLIENKGNSPMYFGDLMIPPGETRMVEDGSPALAETPAGPNLPELMRTLLASAITEILPGLPAMTNEALDLAYDEEGQGKNRKTLLAAIDAERIRRADLKLQEEDAARRAAALVDAQQLLQAAQSALENLPTDAPDAEREQAMAALDEAQAKVDALTPVQAH